MELYRGVTEDGYYVIGEREQDSIVVNGVRINVMRDSIVKYTGYRDRKGFLLFDGDKIKLNYNGSVVRIIWNEALNDYMLDKDGFLSSIKRYLMKGTDNIIDGFLQIN